MNKKEIQRLEVEGLCNIVDSIAQARAEILNAYVSAEDLPKAMNRLRYSKGAAMNREPLNLLVYVIVLVVLVVLLLRVLDHV